MNDVPTEEVYPGIHLEWHDQGSLLVWRVATAAQAGVDAWFMRIEELAEGCNRQQPIRMVFILSQFITVTAYIRKNLDAFAEEYSDSFYGRCAFVITKSPVRGIIKIFAKRELPSKFHEVAFDVFYEYNYALAWVREEIDFNPESES